MPDEQGNARSIGEVWAQIENVHEHLHRMEETIDSPTLTIALYEREVLLICAALPALEISYPCIHELSAHLQGRLIELRRAQEPDWEVFGGTDREDP